MSAQSQSEPFSSHGGSASTTRSMLSNKKKMAFLQTLLLLSLTLMQQRMLCSAAAGVETAQATAATKQQQTSETLSQQQQQQAANTNADPDDWTLTEDSFADVNDNDAEQSAEFELERYQAPFSRPPQNQQQQGGEERPTLGILVVTTVDGTMAGLSKETGEILWTQPGRKHHRESSSMKSSATTSREASEHDHSPLEPLLSTTTTVGRSSEWRTAAVPSMDGKVYLTARSANHGSNAKDAHSEVAVTTTARELVQRAPFVDSRGRVYVGSRTTTVLAVDATTGHVQTVVEGHPNGSNMPPPGGKEQDADHDETDQEHVIWMGRVSYTVSIQEPRSGDLDVQFTATELMSVHDLFLSSPQPNWRQDGHAGLLQQQQQQQKSNGNDQMGSSSSSSLSLSFLVATPSGHVAYWDQAQGRIRWVAADRFDTPVAFCLDADSGDAVTVDLVPDAAMPDGSADYVSQEMQRQLELATLSSALAHAPLEEQQTVVKSMPHSGQLFAMPLGRRSTTTSETAHHQLSPPPSSSTSSSHRQSAAAAVAQSKPSSRVPHIGGGSAGGRHYHFQDAGAAATPRKHHCVPGSLHFPGCLTEFADLTQRGSNFLEDHEHYHQQQQHAIVPSFHYGYLLPEQYQHNRKRSSYERLLKILGSWLAPTIALIFVVSFELGRRKRQTDVVPRIDSAEILADKTAPTKQQHEQQQDQQQQVGLIQVYDDVILGYGGHGTVVYKGMLEGRQVAVKRMLKAYHASADREISLLIESDGHANVVRYFLKEVRGDFVYLALELCDLSLHDMIGTLRSEWEQQEKEHHAPHAAVSRATKTVLFQIASGVRHLHHLRIVHRDLKPANILLADSLKFKSKRKDVDRSTYAKFMDGQYIAKISDMGLGKQLIGQSSYGASLINEASLRGHSNGGQSSIVGAGPGSVGWQAPEVMALRAPSDVSVRSEGSQGHTESLTDSSPNETASNTRTSRSVDIFSLGCIFYSTLMPGCHPFGEWYEREANIMHNKPNIKPLEAISLDAYDLISAMLQRNPTARPTAKQICEHPFFWSAERRLAFLCDFSDRIETDATCAIGDDATSAFATKVLAIERNAAQVVGTSWDSVLDRELVSNVQRFRTYDPSSVRDLLRLIRNKHHHFDELPVSFKESIGSNTEGLLNYFEAKFPSLLIHCFCVCRELLSADDPLSQKYTITSVGRLGMKKLECSVSTIKEVNGAPEPATLVEPETDEPTGQSIVSAPVVEAQEAKETSKSEGKDDTLDALPIVTDKDKETTATLHATAVVEHKAVNENAQLHMSESVGPLVDENYLSKTDAGDIVVWHASAAAKTFHCRGWSRSDEEWERRTDVTLRKLDNTLVRCADDPKFRTRLCNHWDASMGTFCPMRKKGKCIFAHGPVELRVKEPKRHRWGKLVDQNGDNKNPNHSGGEDTYGAARSIESERKQEGKWNTGKPKGKKQTPAKKSPA